MNELCSTCKNDFETCDIINMTMDIESNNLELQIIKCSGYKKKE